MTCCEGWVRRRPPRALLEMELRRCGGGASTPCALDAVGAAHRAGAPGLERELRRRRGGASASKVPRRQWHMVPRCRRDGARGEGATERRGEGAAPSRPSDRATGQSDATQRAGQTRAVTPRAIRTSARCGVLTARRVSSQSCSITSTRVAARRAEPTTVVAMQRAGRTRAAMPRAIRTSAQCSVPKARRVTS